MRCCVVLEKSIDLHMLHQSLAHRHPIYNDKASSDVFCYENDGVYVHTKNISVHTAAANAAVLLRNNFSEPSNIKRLWRQRLCFNPHAFVCASCRF